MQKLQKYIPYIFILSTIMIMIFNDDFGEMGLIFSVVFFAAVFVLMTWWIMNQVKNILTLKKEKKQAEILHLKSQVNPHFFFNTLNNLYGLIGQDNEKAQQLVLKLSDLMRYSIYEGQKDWVSLNHEITYLENYMELHRMRYHKAVDIRFDVDVVDPNVKIMPLLFITMVENAFKHGVEKLRRNAFVHIKLMATREVLDFEIQNNFDSEDMNHIEGIGLKNLQQRLDLVYPKKHLLQKASQVPDIYKIKLRLNL